MVKELKSLLMNHALILREERDSTLRKEYTCISKEEEEEREETITMYGGRKDRIYKHNYPITDHQTVPTLYNYDSIVS